MNKLFFCLPFFNFLKQYICCVVLVIGFFLSEPLCDRTINQIRLGLRFRRFINAIFISHLTKKKDIKKINANPFRCIFPVFTNCRCSRPISRFCSNQFFCFVLCMLYEGTDIIATLIKPVRVEWMNSYSKVDEKQWNFFEVKSNFIESDDGRNEFG